MVMPMLLERVVLRLLFMLAEWGSAKSTTTIDDKIVTEIRTKLEADGKLKCYWLIQRRTFLIETGLFMAKNDHPKLLRQ